MITFTSRSKFTRRQHSVHAMIYTKLCVSYQ